MAIAGGSRAVRVVDDRLVGESDTAVARKDGAAADGRLLVDVTEFVLLVTEFLLSFVGTLAGLKLSSDIAFSFSEPPVS